MVGTSAPPDRDVSPGGDETNVTAGSGPFGCTIKLKASCRGRGAIRRHSHVPCAEDEPGEEDVELPFAPEQILTVFEHQQTATYAGEMVMGPTTLLSGLAVASGAATALIVLRQFRVRDVAAARRLRTRLEGAVCQAVDRFEPGMVVDLPEPARRYFLHAIRPGTPLVQSVRLTMTGEMRLGPRQPWLRLQARQTFAPPAGFVWEASVGQGLMRFAGADTYANGQGRVAFRLWDLVPIVRAGGPNVSRAARGRLAIESIWQPAALLPQRGVAWTSIDGRTARAVVTIDGEAIPLVLTVAPDGSLESAAMERWGNLTPDGRYAAIPFGVNVLAERTFGGYTVPSGVRVAWWYGTDHPFDFFHAEISGADYLPREQRGVTDDGARDVSPSSVLRTL